MQNDLISKEALRISLTTNMNLPRYDGSRLGTDDLLIRQSDVVRLISSQQTIDAVPVLRCKECDAWEHGLCRLLCADTPEYGYCHWARQKGVANDT